MRLPGIRKDADGQINEAGDMLIFVAGHAPIYGRQILYFQDPAFAQRAKVPAPQGSDRLRVEASGEMALEFRLA
jgi:type IV secretion system protein VirD4